MPTLTLAIPRELKEQMESMPEMNWSEIARKAIAEKALEFMLFKSIVEKSKFSAKDAEELSNKVRLSMHKKLKDKGLV